MEVVKEQAALLCNYEVLAYLKTLQSDMKVGIQQEQLATIVYETIQYLEDKPCSLQSPAVVKQFKSAVAPFNLTKIETLQILNERPSTAAEIHTMIEESEERLTDEELSSLLHVVTSILPTDEVDNGNEVYEVS
ncbi:hypothetical protein CHUAL_005774 [Chamberlinius hualienensis]